MNDFDFKAFTPDAELRAYLYQQIQELESFAPATIVLMLDRSDSKKIYRVNLMIAPEQNGAHFQVKSDNAYEALKGATEQAKKLLSNNPGLGQSADGQGPMDFVIDKTRLH